MNDGSTHVEHPDHKGVIFHSPFIAQFLKSYMLALGSSTHRFLQILMEDHVPVNYMHFLAIL